MHYNVVIDHSQTRLNFCAYDYFGMEANHTAFSVVCASHNSKFRKFQKNHSTKIARLLGKISHFVCQLISHIT